MSSRIFVTGATGKIGWPLVRHLISEGHSVAALCRNQSDENALQAAGAEPIRGDLEDTEALRRGATDAEILFHLAGGMRGKGRITPKVLNLEGTQNLLEAIRGIHNLKSFVYASSCAVYGDRSSLWVEEDFKTSPNTRYGQSKFDAENVCLEALSRSGLPVRIARIAAVYGPDFPFTMAEAIRNENAWLPGEGRNCIPLIHIEDCVRALCLIAERGENGSITHVADRTSPSLKEFYAAVHSQVGGSPMRFWSTYIPSYVQNFAARKNEQVQSRLGRKARFTPDNLRLYTNSVRLKTHALANQLQFEWRYPSIETGVPASFSRD
jgi:nucleoside-diphosphate-sugar epimerase